MQNDESSSPAVIVTCEHGGNEIPFKFRPLFASAEARAALQSHRGFDPGTLELARLLASQLKARLCFATTSRLLIELNRTLGHRQLFSEWTRVLSPEERQRLINEYYLPYRQRVEEHVAAQVTSRPVLHVSVHSFTPILNEKTRRTDVGLLFDPSRRFETEFCRGWKKSIHAALPDHAVHFNLPYRGTSDGFTVALRKRFPDSRYAGIELEVNQKFVADNAVWRRLQSQLAASLLAAVCPKH